MAARVFISHVNDDHDADGILGCLEHALSDAGFDVLVDRQRLEPGTVWRQEIYTWLGLCHAAVVLLSSQALERDKFWVGREMELLVWRKALAPTFTLIPVLVPPVTLEQVEGSGRFRDLNVRELHCVDAANVTAAVDAIVAALIHVSEAQRAPADVLADKIEGCLEHARPAGIAAASLKIALDFGPWTPRRNDKRTLAMKLVGMELGQALPAIEELRNRSGPELGESLREVVEILAANWVEPEAARWLAMIACGDRTRAPEKALVLNARNGFAASHYVRRACQLPPSATWEPLAITGVTGETAEAEIADEIDACLERAVRLKPDPFAADERMRRERMLAARRQQSWPMFLAIRFLPSAKTILPSLKTRFPYSCFLLLSECEPPAEALRPTELFHLVEPLIDESRLTAALTAYDLATAKVIGAD